MPCGRASPASPRRDPHADRQLVSKKKNKKTKNKTVSWKKLKHQRPVDERRVAAYARLMEAETILYQRWERQASGMTWVGEALGFPIEETNLWVMDLGQKVAALGGHLELVAVLGEDRLTLMREPGPGDDPEEYRPLSTPEDEPET
jgi:hypothetical protein